MKKKLITITGSLLISLLLIYGVTYVMSLKKVSFTLSDTVSSATVYSSDGVKIEQITTPNNSTRLTKGKYNVVPEGENISKKPIVFTVKDEDLSVKINPPYTDEYLKKLLESERSAISDAISAKYPSLYPGEYTLTHGTFYEQGDWFGGLLEPKISDPRQQKDPYRIVLHKEGDDWIVVRRPEYILSSSRYKEVPIDVLRAINSIAK